MGPPLNDHPKKAEGGRRIPSNFPPLEAGGRASGFPGPWSDHGRGGENLGYGRIWSAVRLHSRGARVPEARRPAWLGASLRSLAGAKSLPGDRHFPGSDPKSSGTPTMEAGSEAGPMIYELDPFAI